MITICFTYFRSLTLANLAAALYSIRRQNLTEVESVIVVDNNTSDSVQEIQAVINQLAFPIPVHLLSYKHGDSSKTHSWSTNVAVGKATTPWVIFSRADYLLDFDLVDKFVGVVKSKPEEWNGFVTSNGCHLADDIETCERSSWRQTGPTFHGATFDYTCIDAGVWMARRDVFDQVNGLDEALTSWGHAQTHFQHKLHVHGTECVRIPQTLFYHPMHGGLRDINLAHEQLREQGINLLELWARYEGVQPYR